MKTEYRVFTCKNCHRFIEIDTYSPKEPLEEHKEPICRNVEWYRCDTFHVIEKDSIAKLIFKVFR